MLQISKTPDIKTPEFQSEASASSPKMGTAAAFAGLFAYALTLSVGPASINAIGKSFRADGKELAALFFLQALGFLMAVSTGALVARRIGKQSSVAYGSLLMAVGCLLFGLAPGYLLSLPAILLVGVGGGYAEPMAMALVSEIYTGRKRTAMMNYSQVAFGIGAIGAPILVGWAIAEGIDWRIGFYFSGIVCFGAFVLSLFGTQRGRASVSQTVREKMKLTDPLLLALAVGMFLYVGAELGTANWVARYFAVDLKTSGVLAASTVSIFWAGITLGRFIAGFLSRHFSDVAIIRFSLVSALIWQIALIRLHSHIGAAVAVALLGLSLAAVWPTILACAGTAFSGHLEAAFSVVVAAGCIGALVVPPAIGAVSDATGWRTALAICPVLGVVNVVLFSFVARRTGRGSEQ